jgi:hypothetical protein
VAVTTPLLDDGLGPARTVLRDEILRWNPVMNLVSRQETPALLDRLLAQCSAGFGLVFEAVADLGVPVTTLGYADVGSGNGLPGLLWAAGMANAGGRGPAWLVEPRARRAWFLDRMTRHTVFPGVAVVAGRWGEPLPGSSIPVDMLVSLKALRLTEPEVLAGLEQGFTGSTGTPKRPQRVVIVRFLGPDPSQDAELVRSLQADGTTQEAGWQRIDCRTLEAPFVRLLATTHLRG